MELLALPARKLGAAWTLGAMAGGVVLTLTGVWMLQIVGGLLMLASLISPIVSNNLPKPGTQARDVPVGLADTSDHTASAEQEVQPSKARRRPLPKTPSSRREPRQLS